MKIKVAVIDDDYIALKSIKNYCEQLNLEVVEACQSPKEFTEKLDSINIDLAIIDYEMPQMNGLELAQLLNSKNIPVIFITGHRDVMGGKAWDTNCIDCMEKPVNIEKLRNAIAKYSSTGAVASDEELEFPIYGSKIKKFKVREIACIKSCEEDTSGNDKHLYTVTGNAYRLTNQKITDLIKQLPEKNFMRIGKSSIVAKSAIDSHTKTFEEVELNIRNQKGPITLSISPEAKAQFKTWYNK